MSGPLAGKVALITGEEKIVPPGARYSVCTVEAMPRETDAAFVAIDEVQDFSPLEVRVLLGCLDERQSITLAGDTQQHIVKDAGFTSWAAFFKDLGLEGTEVTTLEVNYRCTREIAAFATGVLGEYLGRVFDQTKQRPRFIVRERSDDEAAP